MKKLLSVVFVLFALCSCYTAVYNFNEDDLLWMTPYEQGDTIRLETDNGVDLLYIYDKTICDDHNPGIVQNEGQLGTTYNSIGEYQCVLIHKYMRQNTYFAVNKCSDGHLSFSLCMGTRFGFDITDEKNCDGHRTEVHDTITIDDSNSTCDSSVFEVEYAKWSKTEGLIEYRLRDGTVYVKK